MFLFRLESRCLAKEAAGDKMIYFLSYACFVTIRCRAWRRASFSHSLFTCSAPRPTPAGLNTGAVIRKHFFFRVKNARLVINGGIYWSCWLLTEKHYSAVNQFIIAGSARGGLKSEIHKLASVREFPLDRSRQHQWKLSDESDRKMLLNILNRSLSSMLLQDEAT
jgi:hypothetical protein